MWIFGLRIKPGFGFLAAQGVSQLWDGLAHRWGFIFWLKRRFLLEEGSWARAQQVCTSQDETDMFSWNKYGIVQLWKDLWGYQLPPSTHVPKCQVSESVKSPQGWWLHQFPGQCLPLLDIPFHEEIFHIIRSKSPLAQPELFSLVLSLITWEKRLIPTWLQHPFSCRDQ